MIEKIKNAEERMSRECMAAMYAHSAMRYELADAEARAGSREDSGEQRELEDKALRLRREMAELMKTWIVELRRLALEDLVEIQREKDSARAESPQELEDRGGRERELMEFLVDLPDLSVLSIEEDEGFFEQWRSDDRARLWQLEAASRSG